MVREQHSAAAAVAAAAAGAAAGQASSSTPLLPAHVLTHAAALKGGRGAAGASPPSSFLASALPPGVQPSPLPAAASPLTQEEQAVAALALGRAASGPPPLHAPARTVTPPAAVSSPGPPPLLQRSPGAAASHAAAAAMAAAAASHGSSSSGEGAPGFGAAAPDRASKNQLMQQVFASPQFAPVPPRMALLATAADAVLAASVRHCSNAGDSPPPLADAFSLGAAAAPVTEEPAPSPPQQLCAPTAVSAVPPPRLPLLVPASPVTSPWVLLPDVPIKRASMQLFVPHDCTAEALSSSVWPVEQVRCR